MGTAVRRRAVYIIQVITHAFYSICPGRFLADNTVWLAVARMLAVFNLTEATDTEGNMIEPDIKFVTTVSRCVTNGGYHVPVAHIKW